MFYPIESLRRGGRFYLCWVADSWPLRFATITHRQLWSQDIRQICDDLLEVMKNESGRPTNRFSLRLSSQLLRGLVRLYQRKVTVFVGDLCMINAHVMKSTHKKSIHKRSEHGIKQSELPRLVLDIQPDEEAVEERIQNSGNIVAHVEDITLKELTLPENRILLDDGFGELNSDQLLQMLGERSVEMMLFQGDPQHHSVLDLPLDFSTDKSHDKSRIQTAQMERLSEHDVSVFGKSMPEAMQIGDFEKEIPEIPELPNPDPPQTDNLELARDIAKEKIVQKAQKSKPLSDVIVLEELQEEPKTKRRKIHKLVIDKKIILSTAYMRSRVGNINVELRCLPFQKSKYVISLLPTAHVLMSKPTREVGRTLMEQYKSGIGREQEVVLQSDQHHQMHTTLHVGGDEPVFKSPGNLVLQETSKEMDVYTNVQAAEIIPEPDISDMPTQKLLLTPQAQKRVSEEQPMTKRRSGYVSFRQTFGALTAEANKENTPQVVQARRLTALLQQEGLADSREPGEDTKTSSNTSETQLGSLDRTKVSLGDSEVTTDSKKFIREEWGTQGTMHKIYKCIKSGLKPLDVDNLISSGPLLSGHKRVIVAKCFSSILKLNQHGFIKVYKDYKTYEIIDITFGSKVIRY